MNTDLRNKSNTLKNTVLYQGNSAYLSMQVGWLLGKVGESEENHRELHYLHIPYLWIHLPKTYLQTLPPKSVCRMCGHLQTCAEQTKWESPNTYVPSWGWPAFLSQSMWQTCPGGLFSAMIFAFCVCAFHWWFHYLKWPQAWCWLTSSVQEAQDVPYGENAC